MNLQELKKEYMQKEQKILDAMTYEERMSVGTPIKSVCELSSFTACGVQYFVGTTLAVCRFEQFETLQAKVGYGVSFKELFQNISKAYGLLNEMKPMDAGITLFNILDGIRDKATGEENPILQLCALFIYEKGEDLTTYSETVTNQKIDHWKREGIDMESFFGFAFALVRGLTPSYQKASAGTFKHLKTVRAEAKS